MLALVFVYYDVFILALQLTMMIASIFFLFVANAK